MRRFVGRRVIALGVVLSACWSACAADLPVPDGNRTRKLNAAEVIYLATIFGNHLNYEQITLHERSEIPEPFTFAGARTLGNDVYLSQPRYRRDYTRYNGDFWMDDVATLVRELCHVWQSQSHLAGFSQNAILNEHQTYRLDVYKYNIADHLKLTEFRFEQQCQIVFDFLYVRSFQDPQLATYIAILRDGLNPDSILPLPGHGFRNPELFMRELK